MSYFPIPLTRKEWNKNKMPSNYVLKVKFNNQPVWFFNLVASSKEEAIKLIQGYYGMKTIEYIEVVTDNLIIFK